MEATVTEAQHAAPPPRLREIYQNDVAPQLTQRFGYSNPMQVPRLAKVTLNMGIGEAKTSTSILDNATEQLAVISGQRPNVRRARKSIASFKIREGMPVGVSVTLRGARMWEFIDRLVTIAIPRIRDFRGLPNRSFDGRGNYTFGIKEQMIFPEIDYDKVEKIHGMDITIVTSTSRDDLAMGLLRELGWPFRGETPQRVA
jgi:large subunit ribosomal protein L5